jgi:hypothetical protein
MDLSLARIAPCVLAGLLGALGCTPADPELDAQSTPSGRWIPLFDGRGMRHWRVLQGSVSCRSGIMVLDGRKKDASILARGVKLKNGTVEIALWRKNPEANAGPYTVALRLPFRLSWHSIYFVCRPDNVEVCRATSACPCPPPERKATFEKTDRPEWWRFVMNGRTIDCYRSGQEVLSYADANPSSGTIGLTASRCQIEVLNIRYQPAGRR